MSCPFHALCRRMRSFFFCSIKSCRALRNDKRNAVHVTTRIYFCAATPTPALKSAQLLTWTRDVRTSLVCLLTVWRKHGTLPPCVLLHGLVFIFSASMNFLFRDTTSVFCTFLWSVIYHDTGLIRIIQNRTPFCDRDTSSLPQEVTNTGVCLYFVMYSACRPTLVSKRVSLKRITDMRRLTTGTRSEKCVVRRFRRCANVIECTYTNLDSIAYYTPRLYGIAYCSWGYKPVHHVTVLNTVDNCKTMRSIIILYFMGPPSYMPSVVDRNVVMRRIPVLLPESESSLFLCSHYLMCMWNTSTQPDAAGDR